MTINSAIIVGRKPEMPQTPDLSRDAEIRGQAPLTPTSLSMCAVEKSSQEDGNEDPPKVVPLATGEVSSVDKAFTPLLDIPQAPTDKNLQDPSSCFS